MEGAVDERRRTQRSRTGLGSTRTFALHWQRLSRSGADPTDALHRQRGTRELQVSQPSNPARCTALVGAGPGRPSTMEAAAMPAAVPWVPAGTISPCPGATPL